MLRIKNELPHVPFGDHVTHIYFDSHESAKALGFPEGGRWRHVGDLWELEQPLTLHVPFDESKCHECQGWGQPIGCVVCGLTCMGR